MAVIDASVYIALINVDEAGHAIQLALVHPVQPVAVSNIFAPTIILARLLRP